ncbi:MAG: diacylglycerol kinase [Roseovarius sp.]
MSEQKLTGMPRLVAAFRNSMAGFSDVWRSDEAFRIEALLLLPAIPAALWLGKTPFQSALLIAAMLLLVIVEVLNSAIEATIDRIGPERHELSRIAKDLGSLAVLLATCLAALLWLAALWEKLAA